MLSVRGISGGWFLLGEDVDEGGRRISSGQVWRSGQVPQVDLVEVSPKPPGRALTAGGLASMLEGWAG